MSGSSVILHLEKLTKKFGTGYQLGPLTADVYAGDCIAILGKNGAGKTTLFQLVTGNLDATGGNILLEGERLAPDEYSVKRQIGYLPQHLGLPHWVSGREVLTYALKLLQIPNAEEKRERALAYWDCQSFAQKAIATCSHGMQKRISLALATIHDPALLILDEPFSGLDIYHIRALEDVLRTRRENGKTTLISTHIAPYAAKFCNRAFTLEQGAVREMAEWGKQTESARVNLVESFFFSQ